MHLIRSCGYLLLFISTLSAMGQQKISIEIEVPVAYTGDSIVFLNNSMYIPTTDYLPKENYSFTRPINQQKSKLIISSSQESWIYTSVLGKDIYLTEPGDSVYAKLAGSKYIFSGRGAEKFNLCQESFILDKQVIKPFKRIKESPNPVNDFFSYSNSLKKIIQAKLALLERYKDKISPFAYLYYKSSFIYKDEKKILYTFHDLNQFKGELGLTNTDLANIWDSTLSVSLFLKMALHQSDTACLSADTGGFLANYTYQKIFREHNFKASGDFANSRDSIIGDLITYYHNLKTIYTGRALENTLVKILHSLIKQFGFTNEIDAISIDYLSLPGYPEYKNWTRSLIAEKSDLAQHKIAPEFMLETADGKTITLSDIKGKYIILDFWFTGCVGCIDMAKALKQVENTFENNPNVVFLNVSIDKSKTIWENSLTLKKYTTGGGINVYTGGYGAAHPIIKAYSVSSFPTLLLIDPEGNLIQNTNPRFDNGLYITTLIKKKLATMADGPYVLYKKNNAIHYSVTPGEEGMVTIKPVNPPLKVTTDQFDKTFTVELKKELLPEPSIFPQPRKLLALSDVEGNFEALRKLLLNNGVIDSSYNWIFKDGHLVCNGDFFDRGEQVTECLWLIYSLEEKAKANGGYVHFILGNHEIMNLNGNTRYTKSKYRENAILLQEQYKVLWGKDSELGRWLRSKNIIEKIGDLIFVHGGISPYFNRSNLTISEINTLIRPFYDAEDVVRNSNNTDRKLLFRSITSPFWYRGYYSEEYQGYDAQKGEKAQATIQQIDSTLNKFSVQRIVTGHTIVSDSISMHFGGKVINIDTHHAEGKSEALLVERNRFYRVNGEGKRWLLLDPEIPISGNLK